MATYTANTAVHNTLVATINDTVTLDLCAGHVTVVNRTGTAEIYFRVGNVEEPPAAAVVSGVNTYVIPAAIGSLTVAADQGDVVVNLISSGSPSYSVEAIQ